MRETWLDRDQDYCPLPGEIFEGRRVIASGWHTDDILAIMTLEEVAPFYRVDEVPLRDENETGDKLTRHTHRFQNIVPAARFFDETFGLWGE